MKRFIRSLIDDAHTMATEVRTIDLPVNPLSHLLITMEGYNATDEATIAEILAFINTVRVTHLGRSIVSMQSEDLAALGNYLYGCGVYHNNPIATDNQDFSVTVVVPFGRKIYDENECYPKTQKGTLQLTLDTTVPATSWDNATISIAAVELPDANPSRYMKSTTLAISAPGATGDNDIDLPIGNKLIAVVLRLTTVPATSSKAWGIDDAKILMNNVEVGYVSGNAPGLDGEQLFRSNIPLRTIAAQGKVIPNNTLFLDYDPDGSLEYALDSSGASSLVLRATMGVDEACWVSPIEIVDVTTAS